MCRHLKMISLMFHFMLGMAMRNKTQEPVRRSQCVRDAQWQGLVVFLFLVGLLALRQSSGADNVVKIQSGRRGQVATWPLDIPGPIRFSGIMPDGVRAKGITVEDFGSVPLRSTDAMEGERRYYEVRSSFQTIERGWAFPVRQHLLRIKSGDRSAITLEVVEPSRISMAEGEVLAATTVGGVIAAGDYAVLVVKSMQSADGSTTCNLIRRTRTVEQQKWREEPLDNVRVGQKLALGALEFTVREIEVQDDVNQTVGWIMLSTFPGDKRD